MQNKPISIKIGIIPNGIARRAKRAKSTTNPTIIANIVSTIMIIISVQGVVAPTSNSYLFYSSYSSSS